MKTVETVTYFIVGIDGSKTPDPKYWQDRWSAEEAGSESEAIKKHFETIKDFYRDDEKQHVKVLGKIEGEKLMFPDSYVRKFIRENNL